jgi:formylglycine-generating enzyme required for sulfatase activity
MAGTGGTGGMAGTGGTGGMAGTGGTGGMAGTGGTAGMAGTGGTGGMAATGGTGGSAGTAGSGGIAGSAGAAGSAGMTYGVDNQSCVGMTDPCYDGTAIVSCCDEKPVVGGEFPMGRGETGTDSYAGVAAETPEHGATVADFNLDTFEVTVGRFRRFVEQYDGSAPPVGAGNHPLILGSGWQSAWNGNLPATGDVLKGNLKCHVDDQTWTDSPDENESYPITCVSWYEAFAFCAWDGGRLPTEAELEYAAAGGDENRLFPWGQETPAATHANSSLSEHSSSIAVGSHPAGKGRWGHHDLAGSVWEWSRDSYDAGWYSIGECVNCANLNTASDRALRGGCFLSPEASLRAASRWYAPPTNHYGSYGFRCARTP